MLRKKALLIFKLVQGLKKRISSNRLPQGNQEDALKENTKTKVEKSVGLDTSMQKLGNCEIVSVVKDTPDESQKLLFSGYNLGDNFQMQYKRLGRTGLKVSRICLGCMNFGDPKWRNWVLPKDKGMQLVKSAWELGINFFDTANVYSNGVSEEVLGTAVKVFEIPRDEIIIATKCYFGKKENATQKKKILSEMESLLIIAG